MRFRGVLAIEGKEGAGIPFRFAPGALRWPESLPLRLGIDGPLIGKVESIERDGNEIQGEIVLAEEHAGRFKVVDGGIDGFGLAVTVSELEGLPDLLSGGMIQAVAATALPAYPGARASSLGRDAVEYAVEWRVGGVDAGTTYTAEELFGPAPEDASVSWIEWLLRGLDRDGFTHLTIKPYRRAEVARGDH